MMLKRRISYKLVGLAVLGIFCLTFRECFKRHGLQPTVSVHKTVIESRDSRPLSDPIRLEIDKVIDQQRKAIDGEMAGYEYPNGKYGMNVSSLKDLLMEKDGRPTRSVILTQVRSGSSFLGNIISAHPATFYHFEPLWNYQGKRIAGSPLVRNPLGILDSMLKCDYENLDGYENITQNYRFWIINNRADLREKCQAHRSICSNRYFFSNYCRLFPFQSMKIARLRLAVAQELLEDKSLAIRMVPLIRDPRGMLHSRSKFSWCRKIPTCFDPYTVCKDMLSDFKVAVDLVKKYPRNFRVIRYEDLSVDPFNQTKSLYEFYGLNFHPNVQKFLETHTSRSDHFTYGTSRNSKTTPFKWRTNFEFKKVQRIQNACAKSIKLWGYVMAENATHQKTFNPVTSYTLDFDK